MFSTEITGGIQILSWRGRGVILALKASNPYGQRKKSTSHDILKISLSCEIVRVSVVLKRTVGDSD